MAYENLHWYLEIENPDSSYQWKDLNGRNIKRFAFSNLNFWNSAGDTAGASAGPYGLARLENGGTAYYNLDLQLDSILESLPDNFWLNSKTEIPSFSFSISSPWQSQNGYLSTGFWAQAVQLYNRGQLAPLFLWDGAVVKLYISNGQFPGLVYRGSNVWWHPDAGWNVTWAPNTPYDIVDKSTLYFKGLLRSGSEDVLRTPFNVDGIDRRIDAPIGTQGRISDTSSAEIIPIPIGQAQPYADGDNWNAFPTYHENGNNPGINMKTASVDIAGGSNKGILFFDGASGQISASDQVAFSSDSKIAGVSVEISGATLSKSRADSGPWNFSVSEVESLDFPRAPLVFPHTQQLLVQNNEVIGLHSDEYYPASFPIITGGKIVFDPGTLERLESRGWGGSDIVSHSMGDQYRGQSDEIQGGRISFVNRGPVSDFSNKAPVNDSSDEYKYSKGASGDVWKMILRSEFRGGALSGELGDGGLVFSNTNYGPLTNPDGTPTIVVHEEGFPTLFLPAPAFNQWTFVIRPRRIDFGTEDEINGVYISIDGLIVCTTGSEQNYMRIRINYLDSTGMSVTAKEWEVDETDGTAISFDFSESFFCNTGSRTIDEFYDLDLITISINAFSNYNSGKYYHPMAGINGIRMGVITKTPVAGKKLYWYGEGMTKPYGANNVVIDSSAAVKSLLITQAGYDETDISEAVDTTNLKICGALKKQDTLGSLIRKISSESQLLALFHANGDVTLDQLVKKSTIGTITDEMIFYDDSNLPEISYSSSDLMDIYTSIEILFRINPESEEYMGSLVIDGDGWQNWIGQRAKEISPNIYEYNAYDWAQLTQSELMIMRQLCRNARYYSSKIGEQEKTLSIKCDWIRDRATAESLFAKITAWATQIRTNIVLNGDFEQWADAKIGDQFEFGLSVAFENARTDGKTFILTKKQTQPLGDGWGIEVTLSELPVVGGLPSGV